MPFIITGRKYLEYINCYDPYDNKRPFQQKSLLINFQGNIFQVESVDGIIVNKSLYYRQCHFISCDRRVYRGNGRFIEISRFQIISLVFTNFEKINQISPELLTWYNIEEEVDPKVGVVRFLPNIVKKKKTSKGICRLLIVVKHDV